MKITVDSGIALGVLLLLILPAPVLQAAVVPGRWEKIENLRPDAVIIVRTKAGETIEGRLLKLEPETLRIGNAEATAQTYRRQDIQRIETAGLKSGSGKTGALIGMGVGGVGVAVVGRIDRERNRQNRQFRFRRSISRFVMCNNPSVCIVPLFTQGATML